MELQQLRDACTKAGVDSVHGIGYKALMAFRAHLPQTDGHEAHWCGTSAWKNQLDRNGNLQWRRPDMWKESTFDNCVTWQFDVSPGDLIITMHNGDWDGDPTDIRCTWTFEVRDNQAVFDAYLTAQVLASLQTAAYDLYLRRKQDEEDRAVALVYQEFFA